MTPHGTPINPSSAEFPSLRQGTPSALSGFDFGVRYYVARLSESVIFRLGESSYSQPNHVARLSESVIFRLGESSYSQPNHVARLSESVIFRLGESSYSQPNPKAFN